MTTIVFNADLEALATKISFSVGETDVYITNGSTAKLTRNFASGAVEAAVVGAPVVASGFTTFTGQSNYLNTQIDDTALMTIFTICKRPSGWSGDAMVLSNNGTVGGDSGIGASVWLKANGNYAFATARDNGSGGQTAPAAEFAVATPTDWNLLIASCSANLTSITCPTTGQTANSPNTNARYPKTAKLRLGSSYTSHTGAVDVMIAVVIPRVLTTLERDSVVAQLRTYALKYGVTV